MLTSSRNFRHDSCGSPSRCDHSPSLELKVRSVNQSFIKFAPSIDNQTSLKDHLSAIISSLKRNHQNTLPESLVFNNLFVYSFNRPNDTTRVVGPIKEDLGFAHFTTITIFVINRKIIRGFSNAGRDGGYIPSSHSSLHSSNHDLCGDMKIVTLVVQNCDNGTSGFIKLQNRLLGHFMSISGTCAI